MRGTANIKVNKTQEEVWEFISDISNIGRWVEGISEPQITSEGAIAPGSTFTSNYRFDGKTHELSYVVTAYEPPVRFGYRVTGGPQGSLNALDLKLERGATKVTHMMELDVTQNTIGAIFLGVGPIVRLSIMFKLRKDLKRMKALLEAS